MKETEVSRQATGRSRLLEPVPDHDADSGELSQFRHDSRRFLRAALVRTRRGWLRDHAAGSCCLAPSGGQRGQDGRDPRNCQGCRRGQGAIPTGLLCMSDRTAAAQEADSGMNFNLSRTVYTASIVRRVQGCDALHK